MTANQTFWMRNATTVQMDSLDSLFVKVHSDRCILVPDQLQTVPIAPGAHRVARRLDRAGGGDQVAKSA